MATVNFYDTGESSVTADTPGKTLVLDNWATLSRGVVPCVLWVYASDATIGDTGQVLLLDEDAVAVITVDIDNGPGWYSATGDLPATTAKYDIHFGNAVGTIAIKDFSLIPLIV